MMDGMDFMDDMDTEKTHLRGHVHSVHYLEQQTGTLRHVNA